MAVDAGIQNYTGQATENLKIKDMLLNKLKELKDQAEKGVITTTKDATDNLKSDIIDGGMLSEVIIKDKRITPEFMPIKQITQIPQSDIPTIIENNKVVESTPENAKNIVYTSVFDKETRATKW